MGALLPDATRDIVLNAINAGENVRYPVRIIGELNPVCRYWYRELMRTAVNWASS